MGNKNIRLISTGGTIACRPTLRGLAPELTAQDMLKVIGKDTENIIATDLFSMDSSNIQPEEWLLIAKEIRKTAAMSNVDGIVLTHGTDTMAYTASMLSFLLLGISVPVVITGAQKPIIDDNSDGRINLADALIAAQHLPPSVYICFGGSVMMGCRAVKTHTLSAHAFESINAPYIASVKDGDFFEITNPYCDITKKYKELSGNICPDVALIKLIPGTSPGLLASVLSCGIKGLVVESFGLGGVHSFRRDHNEALIHLMQNGVTVVLTSQCLYEAASLDIYEVSRPLHDAGAISAADMTTEAAVTKLMWLLGQDVPKDDIRKLFLHSFCGEIR